MKSTLLIFLLISTSLLIAQSRRLKYTQKIPGKYQITDSYTIKDGDTIKFQSGATVKKLKEKTENGYNFTVEEKIQTTPGQLLFDKKKEYQRRLPGKANVYVKEDDYSKIYVDYFVTHPNYFPKGTEITFINPGKKPESKTLKKAAQYPYYKSFTSPKDLAKIPVKIDLLNNKIDSLNAIIRNTGEQIPVVELQKSLHPDSAQSKNSGKPRKVLRKTKKKLKNLYAHPNLWQAYSKEKLLVYRPVEKDTLTLYKKYPENSYIKLENRQYIKLRFQELELSALTIPFKYRFEIEKGDLKAPSQASIDFNLGTYLGYSWGTLKYRNQASEKFKPYGQSISLGVFASMSVQELDSSSTFLQQNEALTSKQNVFYFSPGFGVVYDVMDFNIGFFLGWDIGLGSVAQKWNYSGRPWIGFGFGYNLGMIGKKS